MYDSVSGNSSAGYTCSIIAGTYYMVCVTYSSIDKKMRLYINGVLVREATNSLSNGHKSINYLKSLQASDGSGYSGHKTGLLSLFNKALTDKEVKQLFDGNRKDFGI